MVEDLQSEESDDDDSSSGEEAAVKANPVSRDSRWYQITKKDVCCLFALHVWYFCMPSVWRNQSDRAVHERKAGEKKRMSRCVNESSRVRTELDKERSLELKERELLESGVC